VLSLEDKAPAEPVTFITPPEAERAALEPTEQDARIADAAGGVTDEAWAMRPSTTSRTNSPR
jgi:hypothetical protein